MNVQTLPRFILVAGLLWTTGISFADVLGGVNPGYVRVKVYEIRVSPNVNCTEGITVSRNAAPDYLDMVNNPTLGSGSIPNGTYNCVMIKMSDFIHFTPATNNLSWAHGTSVCSSGSDYVADVGHDSIATDPDGVTQNLGSKGTEDILWLYIRTGAPTGEDTNAFIPSGGIPLLSPLVVHGDGAHTMVFDFDGKIGEEQDNGVFSCDCDAPTLAFR